MNLCIPESLLPARLLFPVACDPPLDLQSKCSDNKCRVHWKRPEAYEGILEDWQWELAFKAVQEPWEVGEAKGRGQATLPKSPGITSGDQDQKRCFQGLPGLRFDRDWANSAEANLHPAKWPVPMVAGLMAHLACLPPPSPPGSPNQVVDRCKIAVLQCKLSQLRTEKRERDGFSISQVPLQLDHFLQSWGGGDFIHSDT